MNWLTRILRFCEEVALGVDTASAVRHGLPPSDRAVSLQSRRRRTGPTALPAMPGDGPSPGAGPCGVR